MGFRRMEIMDLCEVILRWHCGYSMTHIHRTFGYDRKTIRHYIKKAQELGISRSTSLPDRETLLNRLRPLLPVRNVASPAQDAIEAHQEQIKTWLTQKPDPLKPKSIYELLTSEYGLDVSYSSFKRFIRSRFAHILQDQAKSTCFFEAEPGEEVQIDYAKMGRLFDPIEQRQRDVYAFISMLSYSRLKFVQLVYKQDQKSFAASIIAMLEFFGGVPTRIVIDNLKAAVLKPDRYMPCFNRLLMDLADHYGFFIDPARPGKPKDKAKIERCVPIVREAFRKLKAINPNLTLQEANQSMRHWCRYDNGLTPHSTTGQKPLQLFETTEKPALKPLPGQPFELATWKQAKVHLDQFIQFQSCFYSLPHRYVGTSVWVKGTEKTIRIYDEHFQLICQYVRNKDRRQFDPNHFPKETRLMMKDYATEYLIQQAKHIGPQFLKLIQDILTPHAKLNFRRALALIRLKDHYTTQQLNQAATYASQYKLYSAKTFKRIISYLMQNPNPENKTNLFSDHHSNHGGQS